MSPGTVQGAIELPVVFAPNLNTMYPASALIELAVDAAGTAMVMAWMGPR